MENVHPDALAAARSGAGWAFEKIYAVLAGPVAGYLRAQGVPDPEGETNEVFLRAFRAVASFEGDPHQLRAWIFTIAHHRIIDSRRFAARRPREHLVDACPDNAAPDAARDAMARLDEDRLRHQLNLLPPDQRDVLLMRFVVDLSLEETAAAMDRTVGAVKALQHRALGAVRRNLVEMFPDAVSRVGEPTLTEV